MKSHAAVLGCSLLMFSPLAFTQPQTPAVVSSPESTRVQILVAEGNEFSQKLFDNQKALDRYLEALGLDQRNDEILWRISRAYVDLGEHLPAVNELEKQRQLDVYEKALAYANRAVEANAQSSMAYTRRAIASGRIALFRGVWESLDLVKHARADLEQAITLNPENDVAYYVLGRTHAKVAERPRIFRWPLGLGWASYDDAIRNYERAIELKPDFIMYRLDCARAFVEDGEYEAARRHLDTIPGIPNQDEDDEQFRREARDLLVKIRNE